MLEFGCLQDQRPEILENEICLQELYKTFLCIAAQKEGSQIPQNHLRTWFLEWEGVCKLYQTLEIVSYEKIESNNGNLGVNGHNKPVELPGSHNLLYDYEQRYSISESL